MAELRDLIRYALNRSRPEQRSADFRGSGSPGYHRTGQEEGQYQLQDPQRYQPPTYSPQQPDSAPPSVSTTPEPKTDLMDKVQQYRQQNETQQPEIMKTIMEKFSGSQAPQQAKLDSRDQAVASELSDALHSGQIDLKEWVAQMKDRLPPEAFEQLVPEQQRAMATPELDGDLVERIVQYLRSKGQEPDENMVMSMYSNIMENKPDNYGVDRAQQDVDLREYRRSPRDLLGSWR